MWRDRLIEEDYKFDKQTMVEYLTGSLRLEEHEQRLDEIYRWCFRSKPFVRWSTNCNIWWPDNTKMLVAVKFNSTMLEYHFWNAYGWNSSSANELKGDVIELILHSIPQFLRYMLKRLKRRHWILFQLKFQFSTVYKDISLGYENRLVVFRAHWQRWNGTVPILWGVMEPETELIECLWRGYQESGRMGQWF